MIGSCVRKRLWGQLRVGGTNWSNNKSFLVLGISFRFEGVCLACIDMDEPTSLAPRVQAFNRSVCGYAGFLPGARPWTSLPIVHVYYSTIYTITCPD